MFSFFLSFPTHVGTHIHTQQKVILFSWKFCGNESVEKDTTFQNTIKHPVSVWVNTQVPNTIKRRWNRNVCPMECFLPRVWWRTEMVEPSTSQSCVSVALLPTSKEGLAFCKLVDINDTSFISIVSDPFCLIQASKHNVL